MLELLFHQYCKEFVRLSSSQNYLCKSSNFYLLVRKSPSVMFVFTLTCSPDIVSSAKFVLIVEKDATFQKLLDDDFCTKLSPCIMITVCPTYGFLLSYCFKCNVLIIWLIVNLFCVCARVKVSQMWTAGWWCESLGHPAHPHFCSGGCWPL